MFIYLEHRLATENAQLNGHDNDLTHTNEGTF
jgi:hypothetical protein